MSVTDLPANVTFPPNPDQFGLDQGADLIRSVQAFRNERGDLAIELWGTTTVVTPGGNRIEGQEFQQNVSIEFGRQEFTWHATRWVFEESHDVKQATAFELSGTDREVVKYRRI
jgi:hypothetical protein